MKKIIFLFVLLLSVGMASASIKNVKYASFGTPAGNATYDSETSVYIWNATTNNLMTCFEFANGELANYKTLKFKIELTGGMVRMGYYVGSTFTSFNSYANSGEKTIDLTTLGIDLSTVTKISFGGDKLNDSENPSTCTIKWSEVYLENDDDAVLTALFGSIGGNASYNVPTYGWTNAGSNNLMDVFSGSAGDFSKYSDGVLQLDYTRDENTNAVRIGYHDGSTFTAFNTFYSDGTKTIDLSSKSGNAANAKTIKFGAARAKNGATSGTVTIRPDKMFLVRNEAYNRSFTAGQRSTVWLPFALNAEEVADVGTFYELTAANSTSLTFTEVSTTEAYKPYVFVAKETGTPFSGMKTKTIVAPTDCSYTVGDYIFIGSMKDVNVPNGAYGYNATNGAFSKTTSDAVTIAPFRAYIITKTGATARELNCVFGDEMTGISNIITSEKGDDILFNLSGQRVSANHKGLVVKNGHKFFVK